MDVDRAGLGPADADRTGVEVVGVAQHPGEFLVAARTQDGHVGHLRHQDEIEDAVVRWPVVTGDAGAVEAEDDRLAVEADVEVHLIECPREERRIDRDNRPESAHGEAGGKGHRVLFGDTDIEGSIGETIKERQQTGGIGHRGCDRNDVIVGFTQLDDRLGERIGVAPRFELGGVVHVLDVVVLGGGVPSTLGREDMQDDGTFELCRIDQGLLEGWNVVSVERSHVADAELFEEGFGLEGLTDRCLPRAHRGMGCGTDDRQGLGERLETVLAGHVHRVRSDLDE